jgi:hypothetical protein
MNSRQWKARSPPPWTSLMTWPTPGGGVSCPWWVQIQLPHPSYPESGRPKYLLRTNCFPAVRTKINYQWSRAFWAGSATPSSPGRRSCPDGGDAGAFRRGANTGVGGMRLDRRGLRPLLGPPIYFKGWSACVMSSLGHRPAMRRDTSCEVMKIPSPYHADSSASR